MRGRRLEQASQLAGADVDLALRLEQARVHAPVEATAAPGDVRAEVDQAQDVAPHDLEVVLAGELLEAGDESVEVGLGTTLDLRAGPDEDLQGEHRLDRQQLGRTLPDV